MEELDLAEQFTLAQRGDAVALRELLKRFEEEVRVVVRHRLPRAMRSQYDSMDFVQDVWQSAFTGEGLDLGRFTNPRHLLAYLSGMARNKVYEEYRRRTTQKYDIKRQEPLFVRKGDRDVPRDVAASDPTPSEGAQADDRLAQILRGLGPRERRVVELRRNELTFEEIAAVLGLHESAVRRIIATIRDELGHGRGDRT